MHPTRMAFVAIGTTVAFLAGLAWAGAYFASAGPSASELPHQTIDLPLVASVSTVTNARMSSDFGILSAAPLDHAFAAAITTTTGTTLPAQVAAKTTRATASSGHRTASAVGTAPDKGSNSSTSRPPATSTSPPATIRPPSTPIRATSATTRTSTTVKKAASPGTTILYLETSLSESDDESTDREVVRPRLREDHDG